jgi:hypothetical protein
MRKIINLMPAFILLALLAACSGSFIDPGHLEEAGGFGPGFGFDKDDDKDNDGGGSIDTNLVAKWYGNQELANTGGSSGLAYEFTADGKLLPAGSDIGKNIYTVKSGTITTKTLITGSAVLLGTAKYSISGTKLTISEATPTSGLLNDEYYKRAD